MILFKVLSTSTIYSGSNWDTWQCRIYGSKKWMKWEGCYLSFMVVEIKLSAGSDIWWNNHLPIKRSFYEFHAPVTMNSLVVVVFDNVDENSWFERYLKKKVLCWNPPLKEIVPTTERSKVQCLLTTMCAQSVRRQIRNRWAGISGLSKQPSLL